MVAPLTREMTQPNFQSVAAGATAYVDVFIGWRYHRFEIAYGGTTFDASKVDKLRVKLNDEVIWSLTGAQLDTVCKFDKLPGSATNGIFILDFERIGLLRADAAHLTAINTGVACSQTPNPLGVHKFRIEIDINAAAVAPALGAPIGTYSANDVKASTRILRRETWSEDMASIGENLMATKYNQNPAKPLLSRLFMNDAGDLTSYRVDLNGKRIYDRTKAASDQANTRLNLRATQAGWTVLDTTDQGHGNNALKLAGVKDAQFHATLTAAIANMAVIAETLGTLRS